MISLCENLFSSYLKVLIGSFLNVYQNARPIINLTTPKVCFITYLAKLKFQKKSPVLSPI